MAITNKHGLGARTTIIDTDVEGGAGLAAVVAALSLTNTIAGVSGAFVAVQGTEVLSAGADFDVVAVFE